MYEHEGKLYRIQLWDLAGEDKNSMVTKIYSKDAHGAVIMGDATNIQDRENLIQLKKIIDNYAKFIDGKEIPCILVENKIEFLEEKNIFDQSFEDFYKNNGFIKGFRTSSKTGEKIDEAMNFLIQNINKRIEIMEKNKKEDSSSFETKETKEKNNKSNNKKGCILI